MYKYLAILLFISLFYISGCAINNVKQGESYLDRKTTDIKDEGKITRKYRIYIYKKGTSQEQIDSVLDSFYNDKPVVSENINE